MFEQNHKQKVTQYRALLTDIVYVNLDIQGKITAALLQGIYEDFG